MSDVYEKDPSETLDYTLDWSSWLASGDTIASSTWTVESGLTEVSTTNTTTATAIWLSGGTAGQTYTVTNSVTCSSGRVGDRSFSLSITQQSLTTASGTTARTLIERAMRLVGILASGESPTSDEANDALVTLNALIDEWALQGLTVYQRTRVTEALVAAQADYTIGPSSAHIYCATRPVRIESAMLLDTSVSPSTEVSLDVLSRDDWQATSPKSLTSTQPSAIYYEPTHPNGTITVWPIPTVATHSLVLYLPVPVAQPSALTTVLSLPPGYLKGLTYHLALDLATEYGRPVDQLLFAESRRLLGSIKRANFRPDVLAVDAALLGGGAFDIQTGT